MTTLKTTVKLAPYDRLGNLMHWARAGSGYGEAEEWRDNVPFVATMTIFGMESGRSAKYLVLADEHGHTYSMFVTDLIDALRTEKGVRLGGFGPRRWIVCKRGQNYGVKLAPEEGTQ